VRRAGRALTADPVEAAGPGRGGWTAVPSVRTPSGERATAGRHLPPRTASSGRRGRWVSVPSAVLIC